MAVPQRRTSKTAKRLRRSHLNLKVSGITTCSNCGEMTKQHTVCPHCGYYDGKEVLHIKSKKAN